MAAADQPRPDVENFKQMRTDYSLREVGGNHDESGDDFGVST